VRFAGILARDSICPALLVVSPSPSRCRNGSTG